MKLVFQAVGADSLANLLENAQSNELVLMDANGVPDEPVQIVKYSEKCNRAKCSTNCKIVNNSKCMQVWFLRLYI